MQDADLTLVCAESCTGGWIAQAVTGVAGSSRWFDRGFVTYSNEAKTDLLGVRAATLVAHGAVSEPVVLEMAAGALAAAPPDRRCLAVAVSGVAGPGGGTDLKPVGTVCIAWAGEGAPASARRFRYPGDRAEVRARAVRDALAGLIERTGAVGP